jgi:hypothetical protein
LQRQFSLTDTTHPLDYTLPLLQFCMNILKFFLSPHKVFGTLSHIARNWLIGFWRLMNNRFINALVNLGVNSFRSHTLHSNLRNFWLLFVHGLRSPLKSSSIVKPISRAIWGNKVGEISRPL